jgi:hypothetical protein
MYFLLQSSIIFAVVASNIRWHWTPNGYLARLNWRWPGVWRHSPAERTSFEAPSTAYAIKRMGGLA